MTTRTLTTSATFTLADVHQLRSEAGAAGDEAMVKVCDRAIGGSKRARAECLKVIREVQRERLGR